jgi:cobyrinic acid a,c-diamide synthase
MIAVPRLAISAPHRSSGKSTVSIGLCAALRRRGRIVQPFKKGPDFIDPMWLSAAAGRRCRNLDFFMMGGKGIVETFLAGAGGADLSIVECNHGLHDGLDPEGSDSSAALALLLGAPVLLVVNARGMNRGVAPLVQGQVGFEPDLHVGGVVLNNVSGSRHEKKIRDALGRYCDLPVLGVIPHRPELEIAERHLGLTPLEEDPALADRLERLASSIEECVDVEAVERLAVSSPPLAAATAVRQERKSPPAIRLGLAFDRAFNFYYPENLEALEAAGAELVTFSPLEDPALPNLDGIYIGGGFPEFFMEELEGNVGMRESLLSAVGGGLPLWAECGGLMYLARSLRWRGKSSSMVGALPCDIEVGERPAGHGYVLLEERGTAPWQQSGRQLRGHEFHHSRISDLEDGIDFAYRTIRGSGSSKGRDGIVRRNCIATYTHLHHRGAPFWAKDFVAFIKKVKGEG